MLKKIFKNKIVQFALIFLLIIFLFSAIFPQSRPALFFRNSFAYIFSPIEGFFYSQGLKLKSGISGLSEVKNIRQERDELKSENKQLQEEIVGLKELREENKILRKQLGLKKKKPKLNLTAAEIISQEVSGFSEVVVIGKGKREGIEVNDPVVSGNYLIGKVIKSYSTTAHVRFITSVDSVVNGLLQSSRANGIVKGQIGYGLKMESIPKNSKIKDNEPVITSGLGGTYPKGLIIGYVDEVLSQQGDIFKQVSLITPVNFSNLEIVFVVK